jgi:hypothetical protein
MIFSRSVVLPELDLPTMETMGIMFYPEIPLFGGYIPHYAGFGQQCRPKARVRA